MSFKTFFMSMDKPAREEFAQGCGASAGHLMNCMYGMKAFAPGLAVAIERESRGVAHVEEMCPDEQWVRIKDKRWPNPKGRPLWDASKQQAHAEQGA